MDILAKLKALGYVFVKSATSPNYYKEILNTDKSFTRKYVTGLFVAIVLLVGIPSSIFAYKPLISTLEEGVKGMVSTIPADLELYISKEGWNVNKPEPVGIEVPTDWEDVRIDGTRPRYFIVFFHEGTIEDLYKLNTIALLNKSNLLIRKSEGASSTGTRVEALPLQLKDMEKPVTLSKDILYSYIQKAKEPPVRNIILGYYAVIAFFGIIMGVFILFIYYIGITYRNAFLMWLLSKITNRKETWSQWVRLAKHSGTLTMVLVLLNMLINSSAMHTVASWSSLLMLIAYVKMTSDTADTEQETPKELLNS